MNTVQMANVAGNAAGMLKDGHSLDSICDAIREHCDDDLTTDQKEGEVCHILKVMYSNLSREMGEAADEYRYGS